MTEGEIYITKQQYSSFVILHCWAYDCKGALCDSDGLGGRVLLLAARLEVVGRIFGGFRVLVGYSFMFSLIVIKPNKN